MTVAQATVLLAALWAILAVAQTCHGVIILMTVDYGRDQ